MKAISSRSQQQSSSSQSESSEMGLEQAMTALSQSAVAEEGDDDENKKKFMNSIAKLIAAKGYDPKKLSDWETVFRQYAGSDMSVGKDECTKLVKDLASGGHLPTGWSMFKKKIVKTMMEKSGGAMVYSDMVPQIKAWIAANS